VILYYQVIFVEKWVRPLCTNVCRSQNVRSQNVMQTGSQWQRVKEAGCQLRTNYRVAKNCQLLQVQSEARVNL